MNDVQKAKVEQFKQRTRCDDAEAEKWMKQAQFRVEVAIRMRNQHYEQLHRARVTG